MVSRKVFIFTKNLVLLFENNQIITASRIMILTYEMTMNKRLNMMGQKQKKWQKWIFRRSLVSPKMGKKAENRVFLSFDKFLSLVLAESNLSSSSLVSWVKLINKKILMHKF